MEKTSEHYYLQTLELKRDDQIFQAELCLAVMTLVDLERVATSFLHPKEYVYYSSLEYDRRKLSYLLGRFTAKQAIARFAKKNSLQDILIDYGAFQYPLIYHSEIEKIQVSYSHTDVVGVAIAHDEIIPMGIDIEAVDPEKNAVIESQLTPDEKILMNSLTNLPLEKQYTLLWTVKEALSKVLRTGLTTPFEVFAIKSIKIQKDYWVSEFKNFAQYQAISFALNGFICTIVLPKRLQITINIADIQAWFNTATTHF